MLTALATNRRLHALPGYLASCLADRRCQWFEIEDIDYRAVVE